MFYYILYFFSGLDDAVNYIFFNYVCFSCIYVYIIYWKCKLINLKFILNFYTENEDNGELLVAMHRAQLRNLSILLHSLCNVCIILLYL